MRSAKNRVKNIKDKRESDFQCDGVFVLIGYVPNTGFIKGALTLDENGYVIAEDSKTSEAGIFAAGDVKKKLLRQVVTAAGDGANAAEAARMYVDELKGTAYK